MFKLLIISSRMNSGVHQIVVEFPTFQEADTAFDNIIAAKPCLHTATHVIKLY